MSIIHRAPERASLAQPVRFGHNRSARAHYASYDISVPPSHQTGKLELGSPADPAKHFALHKQMVHSAPDFMRALNADGDRDAELTIFVHGYNYTHAEAVLRQAQIKRDFGLSGPHILFSWPSQGSAFGYVHDRDSAAYACDGLEAALRMLTSQQRRPVVLVAHSMGAWLAMETLRQIGISGRPLARSLAGMALISPDIDISVFRKQIAQVDPLPQPTLVLISQADRALRLSARLSGQPRRLGNIRDLAVLRTLGVQPVDLSDISDGERGGHFNAATSPTAIAFLEGLRRGISVAPKAGARASASLARTTEDR